MKLTGLVGLLRDLSGYRHLLDAGSDQPLALTPPARPLIAVGKAAAQGGALVVLTARQEMAQQLVAQLELWLPHPDDGGPPVLLFAEPDALPYERIAWSSATRQRRLTALAMLQSRSGPPPVIVAGARALMQKTLPARELRMALRPLRVGDALRLDQATIRWVETGYNPADVVEEPGTFARRGGIVDIWPPNLPHPVRIDLFGDEVESLRLFDPATQRTLRKVSSVEIGPGSEALAKYGPNALARLGLPSTHAAAEVLETGAAASPLTDPHLLLAVREEIRSEVEHMAEGRAFHGIEW